MIYSYIIINNCINYTAIFSIFSFTTQADMYQKHANPIGK